MAIAKMKKFQVLTFDSHKDALLRELQIFRDVDFVDLNENVEEGKKLQTPAFSEEEYSDLSAKHYRIQYAVDLLHRYHTPVGGLKGLIQGKPNYTFEEMEAALEGYDWETVYRSVKEVGDELDHIDSRISKLREEKEMLSSWKRLDINPKDLERVTGVRAILGSVPTKLRGELLRNVAEMPLTYVEQVGSKKDEDHYLVVFDPSEEAKLQEVFRESNFSKVNLEINETPSDRIDAIDKEIETLKGKRAQTVEALEAYTAELPKLELEFEYTNNLLLRSQVNQNFVKTEHLYLISGWVPADKEGQLKSILQSVSGEQYYLEMQDAEKDDPAVPIQLKNGKLITAFENLTETYSMPMYNEIDPTPLLMPFYFVFFGMMSADFMYGFVLCIGTFLALRFANLSVGMEKFVRFFHILSYSTMFWGFLYGSYFGFSIPGLWKWVDPGTDFMTIMILSLVLGGIHLATGLGIKAYMLLRDGKPLDAFCDVGLWYMAVGGLVGLLVASILGASPMVVNIAKWVMIIGMVGIVLTGGRDSDGPLPLKLVLGLYSLYDISSYVGDFVSYTRLMALGLSGGFISLAVNMIAGMLGGSLIGIPFAIIVLVGMHLFNMFLSFLSAYVHGSRLIFVEFFGKFYEGGGKAFKPFRAPDKYINLDRELQQ